MMPERCKKCHYFSAKTFTCDYILLTGRRRGSPANECLVYKPSAGQHPMRRYIPGERKARNEDRLRQRDAAMLQLYEQGMNDHQIAAELSCGPTTVRTWRCKAGLPTQKERQVKEHEEAG